MTGQIHDLVECDGTTYCIAQIDALEGSSVLFDPHQYGFASERISTGCYRGYYCTYSIIEKKLYLNHLVINDRGAATKLLNGQTPLRPTGHIRRRQDQPDLEPLRGRHVLNSGLNRWSEKWYHVEYDGFIYSNLRLPLTDFSGHLVLGTDLDTRQYVHMGFQSPGAFRTTKEITIEHGVVCQTRTLPSLSSRLEPTIRAWAHDENGKTKDLHVLLETLDRVLWPEAKWTPVESQHLMKDGSKLKHALCKAIRLVHPDKVHQHPPDQRFLAKRIFDILCHAKRCLDETNNRKQLDAS